MHRIKKNVRIVMCTLVLCMMLSGAALANTHEGGVTVQVNGKELQAERQFLAGGKTYVDAASFLQMVGVPYVLNEAEQTLTIRDSSVPAVNHGGIWVAHVRELAEAVGAASVKWNGLSNTVDVVLDAQLIVYGDTVLSGLCIPQSRFTAGESIIFRMTALHPLTRERVEDAILQVHLSTGEVLDMHLGPHPPGVPDAEYFWTARYDVTKDTPTGTLNYFVTAKTETMSGQFQPFNVMPSLLTIVADEATPADETSSGNLQ